MIKAITMLVLIVLVAMQDLVFNKEEMKRRLFNNETQ